MNYTLPFHRDIHILIPETMNMLYYKERRIKDVDEIKTLRWGNHFGLSKSLMWSNSPYNVNKGGRRGRVRVRELVHHCWLWRWKGSICQRVLAGADTHISKKKKKKERERENVFFLKLSKKTIALLTFQWVRPFWPPEC